MRVTTGPVSSQTGMLGGDASFACTQQYTADFTGIMARHVHHSLQMASSQVVQSCGRSQDSELLNWIDDRVFAMAEHSLHIGCVALPVAAAANLVACSK
jgi:hypothetical protein